MADRAQIFPVLSTCDPCFVGCDNLSLLSSAAKKTDKIRLIRGEIHLLADESEDSPEYFSNGEVLPPRGFGSVVPSS